MPIKFLVLGRGGLVGFFFGGVGSANSILWAWRFFLISAGLAELLQSTFS